MGKIVKKRGEDLSDAELDEMIALTEGEAEATKAAQEGAVSDRVQQALDASKAKTAVKAEDLSDEELDALYAEQQAKESEPVSPEDVDGIMQALKSGGSALLETMGDVGAFVDSFTGAPARAGIGALQAGAGAGGSLAAAIDQFGKPASEAPTGKEIALNAGLSAEPFLDKKDRANTGAEARGDFGIREGIPASELPNPIRAIGENVSPAGTAGLAVDVLADPTLFLPIGSVLRGAGKAAGAISKMALGGAAKTADIAAHGAGVFFPSAEKAARATGAVVMGAGESIANAARALGRTVKPSIREDFTKSAEIALRNGIDPEVLSASIKYGPYSQISIGRRVQTQSSGGEQLRLAHEAGLDAIREAHDKALMGINGGPRPMSPTAAGELLREKYNEAVEALFQNQDVTYTRIGEQYPKLKIPPDEQYALAVKIQKKIDEMAEQEAGEIQPIAIGKAKVTREGLEKVMLNLRFGSYNEAVKNLRRVGSWGWKAPVSQNDIPIDKIVMRELYNDLQNTIVRAVAKGTNPKLAQKLQLSNIEQSEFFRNNERVGKVMYDDKSSGEKIFNDMIGTGDSAKIRAIREVLQHGDPSAIRAMQATYLDSLGYIGADDGLSFRRLQTKVKNEKRVKNVLSELFDRDDPALKNWKDLVWLGDEYGPAIVNTSGTDVSKTFRDPIGTMAGNVVSDSLLSFLERQAGASKAGKVVEEGIAAAKAGPVTQAPEQMRNIEEALHAIESEQKPWTGMNAQTPKDFLWRALKLIGNQQESMNPERRKPVTVPPQMREEVRKVIKESHSMNSIEKAKNLNALNRHGHVLDVSKLERNPADVVIEEDLETGDYADSVERTGEEVSGMPKDYRKLVQRDAAMAAIQRGMAEGRTPQESMKEYFGIDPESLAKARALRPGEDTLGAILQEMGKRTEAGPATFKPDLSKVRRMPVEVDETTGEVTKRKQGKK